MQRSKAESHVECSRREGGPTTHSTGLAIARLSNSMLIARRLIRALGARIFIKDRKPGKITFFNFGGDKP